MYSWHRSSGQVLYLTKSPWRQQSPWQYCYDHAWGIIGIKARVRTQSHNLNITNCMTLKTKFLSSIRYVWLGNKTYIWRTVGITLYVKDRNTHTMPGKACHIHPEAVWLWFDHFIKLCHVCIVLIKQLGQCCLLRWWSHKWVHSSHSGYSNKAMNDVCLLLGDWRAYNCFQGW